MSAMGLASWAALPRAFEVTLHARTRLRVKAAAARQGDDDTNARKGRRRERNAQLVMFRRGAYKNLDEQAPWLTKWSAASDKLSVVDGVHASDAQAALNRQFIVEAYVEPAGASGFFVDGVVTGDVFVKCACCGANYAMALPAATDDATMDDAVRFLAFLDADAKEESTSGDYDVFPFPRSIEELDLTPLVRDSVRAFGLPSETVCAECDDDENFATWSIDDAVNAAP